MLSQKDILAEDLFARNMSLLEFESLLDMKNIVDQIQLDLLKKLIL